MNQVEELKAALLATQELNDQFLKQKNQATKALVLERQAHKQAVSSRSKAFADIDALRQDIENALSNLCNPDGTLSDYQLSNITAACYNLEQLTKQYL